MVIPQKTTYLPSQNQKVLSLILCSLLLIGLVPVAAQAEGESEPPTVESGTEKDPYLISSADDLTCLAEFVNEGNVDTSTILTIGEGAYVGGFLSAASFIDGSGISCENCYVANSSLTENGNTQIGIFLGGLQVVAVYRLYNLNVKGAGSHHYMTSIGERAILIKLGWKAEGIAWDDI